MTNFIEGTYKIHSSNAGFSSVTRPDGILHNLSDKTISRLKKQKGFNFVKVKIEKEPVIIEPKSDDIIPDSNESEIPDLSKLNKDDLSDLAKRYGFADEINNEVTKAILIKFIEDNS